MKFFGKNNFFNNVWSNSNWTLPSYGNLITGKYVAGHGCFDSETFYNDQSQVKYNTKMNLYESFSKNNFVRFFRMGGMGHNTSGSALHDLNSDNNSLS